MKKKLVTGFATDLLGMKEAELPGLTINLHGNVKVTNAEGGILQCVS